MLISKEKKQCNSKLCASKKDGPPRHLIVTADERTWKFDRPVIFLGEWCCLYDRKHIWQKMDAIVAQPYGLGLQQKDADYAQAKELEESLLNLLSTILNKHHNTQYSQRFWKILLGHWLRRYINVMINRIKTLEQCLQSHEISGITAYSQNSYALAPSDSYSAIWAFSDNHWNHELTIKILRLLKIKNIQIDLISNEKEIKTHTNRNLNANISSLKKNILLINEKIEAIARKYLMRESDAFIINSYLSNKEAVKLQLALFQYPQLWRSPKPVISTKANQSLREQLAMESAIASDNVVETISKLLLFHLIPICYLEGFNELNHLTEQKPWPKKPKFIFTSNNFDTDEIFKLWTAKKTESGVVYIAGQHGNNYGTYRYMNPSIEESTADKFLTWGWTDGLPQHQPAFIFKTINRKKRNYSSKGRLLLVELCLSHRIVTWDSTSEFSSYFYDQQYFISKLAPIPKNQLTIRLHSAYRNMTWNEELRWKEFDSKIKVETGHTPINELLAKSRLVVHSYDSTGILETLSQNIPTLAFWQNGFDHLRETAKPQYQLLVDAGIVHLSPESVAQKVNEVWDNVDDWWTQSSVQDAREKFCDYYAKVSQNPLRDLKKILLE